MSLFITLTLLLLLLAVVIASTLLVRTQRRDMEKLQQQCQQLQREQLEAAKLATINGTLSERNDTLMARVGQLDKETDLSREALKKEQLTNANLVAENKMLKEKGAEQLANFEAMKQQMTNEFKLLANSILEEKTQRFTETNKTNIDNILSPLQQKLAEFKTKVEETYDKESKERFSLDARIRELVELNQRISQEASNLTKALKGDSKIQGDWGEMILESILEKSGLVKGREYFTQETLSDEDGKTLITEAGRKMRPDVIVVYPDQRRVVIDAKVSLTAYARYVEATTPEESSKAMAEHIRSVKSHIDELAAKRYNDYVQGLDFVMMFVPNEPACLVAMQHDPTLWQYAYNKRVMLISPTNLIAALKLVADLWKRDNQSRNAIDIAERGGALYDKFVSFIESLGDIGKNLERTQASFVQAQKQLNTGAGNLIGQVEKLRTLGVKAKKQLPASLLEERSDNESKLQ